LKGACPNLLAEALLYRYEGESEEPLKENDHALDALRYMISMPDQKKMARMRKRHPLDQGLGITLPKIDLPKPPRKPPKRKWLSIYNEALWTPIATMWREP